MSTINATPVTHSQSGPDYAAVKQRQQATWASGDFSVVAARILYQAEQLCETAELQAGWRVLDVATGSGNAALAAARRHCDAVGVDYVPTLLERGRIRAEAERLSVEFLEGDAEQLPFPAATFDAVLSIYGVMFAPHHQLAADELLRVCRPGGRIALACWTPEGFIGQMFATMKPYLPPPPAGAQPPPLWGNPRHVESLLGDRVTDVLARRSTLKVDHFSSGEEFRDYFKECYGPTIVAYRNIAHDKERVESLDRELAELGNRNLAGNG